MSREKMLVRMERLRRANSGATFCVVVTDLHPHESSAVTSVLTDKRIDAAKGADGRRHYCECNRDDGDGGDGGDGAAQSYLGGARPRVRPGKQHWPTD